MFRQHQNRRPLAKEAAISPESIADADHLIARGQALEDSGQPESALACYREALDVAPGYARAHMNVGNALRALGRHDEAITQYQAAVECAPELAPARFNLGAELASHGAPDAAERELRTALRLQPDLVETAIPLADLMEAEGRPAEAEALLDHALRTRPDFTGAALNLGQLLLRQSRFADAERWLLRATTLGSALARDALSGFLFRLNFRSDLAPSDVFDAHVQVGDIIARWAGPPFAHWSNDADAERRLKIGYVSGDFGEHAVGLFVAPLFEHHNRAQVTLYAYSARADVDPVKRKLMAAADHWREIAGRSDFEVAKQIRADGIDILVDLSGHTKHTRLPLFALRPAPVQAAWLGYLNTTGMRAIDYRIVDRHTDPSGATEHLHSERLFRMPNSQWCYVPWYDIPPVPVPHAERPGKLVFGSFNNHEKISDHCLEVWSRVLQQLPESELLLLGIGAPRLQDAMKARLSQCGIAPDRIVIRGRAEILDYFAAIGNVDIALDTFPYNGATTTLDTLWMGVPLVALRGDRGIARGSCSILASLSMPELIAATPDEYVAANVSLARDTARRVRMRATLRSRLIASPLTDSPSFAADLEAGFRQMWRDWCAAQAGGAR